MARKNKSKWNEYSDLEVLKMLREELERLDLLENPSRTAYFDKYDKDRSMSPTNYMYRFDKSWSEILEMIGVEYDKKKIASMNGKRGKGKKKSEYKSRWGTKTDKEILDIVKSVVGENKTRKYYDENRDPEDTPSVSYLRNRFGAWKNILDGMDKND